GPGSSASAGASGSASASTAPPSTSVTTPSPRRAGSSSSRRGSSCSSASSSCTRSSENRGLLMPTPSRRAFLRTSAAVAAAPLVVPAVHAAGNDTLRVGLIGCGSRGTGAAVQALRADKNVKLVAMGDAFEDRLKESLAFLLEKEEDVAAKVD